jgi:mono/diheme cytochrome c family protein
MKKVLKWIGIVIGLLLGLVVLIVAGLSIYANTQFKPTYRDRPLYPITADTSPAGVERGKYLMEDAILCTEACHTPEAGPPLSGGFEELNQGPISVTFARPNLTPDKETGLGNWTDAEIARAIREGVDKDGVGLMVMPAYSFHYLSDQDVAAMIGYLRSLDPVSNAIPPFKANMVAKIMNALGVFGPGSVTEPITTAQVTPPQGTAEHGKYMVKIGGCEDCHKPNLAGGPLPFAEPGQPPSANLTPAGELVGWTVEDFIKAVTEGIKPDGSSLREPMPHYKMTNADLADIFTYLQTVPAAQPAQ